MRLDYNRAAAFLEYSRGTQLDEISHTFAIPLDKLQKWAHEEKWAALAVSAPNAAIVAGRRGERAERERQVKIEANRAKNLAIAQGLQEDLIEVLGKLRKGTLRVVRVFANGSKAEVEPGLRDRCDLALYAKGVADLGYRALGDVPEAGQNARGGDALPGAGQISIILPSLVAAPRQDRQERAVNGPQSALDVECQTVTLDLAASGPGRSDARSEGEPEVSPE